MRDRIREPLDVERLRRFLRELSRSARQSGRVYLTGGATALLEGWRTSTVDVDLALVPDQDELLRAIPRLKDELHINVELAAPSDFIPPLPGWQERSRFVAQEGLLAVYEYDFYAQALSKIERGHTRDREDVAAMLTRGLVTPDKLKALFTSIEPLLYRYPAIDAAAFRRAVTAVTGTASQD